MNTAKEPAVLKMDILGDSLVAAGKDGNVTVVDIFSFKAVANLKAHKGIVFESLWIDDKRILTGSNDGSSKVLQLDGTKKLKVVTEMEYSSKTTDLSLHPCKKYFVSAGAGWALNEIETSKVLTSAAHNSCIDD